MPGRRNRLGEPPPVPRGLHPLRKLRRYLATGAAFSPAAYVRWRHYCGNLDAQEAWHRNATRDATPTAPNPDA